MGVELMKSELKKKAITLWQCQDCAMIGLFDEREGKPICNCGGVMKSGLVLPVQEIKKWLEEKEQYWTLKPKSQQERIWMHAIADALAIMRGEIDKLKKEEAKN